MRGTSSGSDYSPNTSIASGVASDDTLTALSRATFATAYGTLARAQPGKPYRAPKDGRASTAREGPGRAQRSEHARRDIAVSSRGSTPKVEDWGRVGAAAAGGAVSGAVQAALPGAGTAAMVAVGVASGAAGGATERLVASGGKSAGDLTVDLRSPKREICSTPARRPCAEQARRLAKT